MVGYFIRDKPTHHKQDCSYCGKAMLKGGPQVVYEYMQWIYVNHSYFHPDCAMVQKLQHQDFVHHFHIRYHKELTAENFDKVFNGNAWKKWAAHYIREPFEIYRMMKDTYGKDLPWLEEVFKKMCFDKVFTTQ